MNRRNFIKTVGAGIVGFSLSSCSQSASTKTSRPNIVLIFTDDQGYADLGCYGAKGFKTPNIDQMAEKGMKFTSFYAQPICGPSRAALMTGCYPMRIAEPDNIKRGHSAPHPKEIFISELLSRAGYKTACLGKWHLGWQQGQRPWEKGFDYFYGTPYYNGFFKKVEDHKDFTSTKWVDGKPQIIHKSFTCRLWENAKPVETIDSFKKMGKLTSKYTQKAVNFISENKGNRFFLYLAHNMPHIPLAASEKFQDKTQRGLYGDVIEEIDWSVGQVLQALEQNGIADNTLVIFTSDNGPWIEKGRVDDHGGSAYPLKGFKMSTWEGGFRVPCLMQWPGVIPKGKVCDRMAATMDLFVTFANLAKAKIPRYRTLDSRDILPLMKNPKNKMDESHFYYYLCNHLQAVRVANWKLVVPRQAKPPFLNNYGRLVEAIEKPLLFDLEKDNEEKDNLAEQFPDKVTQLYKEYEKARNELGDYDRIGSEQRFFDPGPKRPDIGQRMQ